MNDRQLAVLCAIPPAPAYATVKEIAIALRQQGHSVHARSIQRDLVALSRLLPLRIGRPGKPYAWQWSGVCPCCRCER